MVRPKGYSSAETFLGEERQERRMTNTSPKIPTQSMNSLHFCQTVHAEKNNDWEMSVFWLWEHQRGIFLNFHLKLLELFLFLPLICLSSLLRETSDKNISFDPKWLRGEKVFSFSVCQHFAYNLSEYSVNRNHPTNPSLLMQFNQQPKGSRVCAETLITPCL